MINKVSKSEIRRKKHARLRNRISGTAEKPRLSVFRSNNHMYAQIIDDTVGNTLWRSPRRLLKRASRKSFSTEAVSSTMVRSRRLQMQHAKPVLNSKGEVNDEERNDRS